MKLMKKTLALLLAVAFVCASFAGCTSNAAAEASPTPTTPSESTAPSTAPDDSTVPSAADKAILVVSFGTSYNNSRTITIGGIEDAITEAYPDYLIKRAFTAQTIIDILKERDGLDIDNVSEALDELVADGVKTLVVQPTHLMDGYEYNDLIDMLKEYADKFDSISVGNPLLYTAEDRAKVIDIITAQTAAYDDGNTAIIFMGHGTEADSNGVYATLQEEITAAGYANYYIGTVEATPSLEDVIADAKAGGYSRVVLEPLMVVAGDHANNDMAGDDADSWKSAFEAEGFDVVCLIRGLGQFWDIQSIYVQHVQDAIDGNATIIK